MNKLKFSIQINASREKVWNVLWDDDTYRKWTSVFDEGSYAVSDWKEGSKVLFLSSNGDGMYSSIERKIPYELMAIKHNGMVKDGKEQPADEKTKEWAGAMETYTLTEEAGSTKLTVEIDITEDMQQYFRDTFPKALDKVKSLSEEA